METRGRVWDYGDKGTSIRDYFMACWLASCLYTTISWLAVCSDSWLTDAVPKNSLLYILSLSPHLKHRIDGFQISIKCPTSGGQMRDQEAAVQQIFHLERSSFFYLSAPIVKTRCSASLPVFSIQLHWTHTPTLALQKWSYAPWKPSIAKLLLNAHMGL